MTTLVLLCFVSIVFYQWLITSGNDFVLGEYVAFPPILDLARPSLIHSIVRVILMNFAWIINCLPYFFMALLLNQVWRIENRQWLYHQTTRLLLLFCLVLMNIVKTDFVFAGILKVAIAYCLLLFGISISRRLNSKIIIDLGYCSFGIYFIHPYIKSIVSFIFRISNFEFFQSISIFSMLLYAIPTFVLSWLVIHILKKNKFIAQYI